MSQSSRIIAPYVSYISGGLNISKSDIEKRFPEVGFLSGEVLKQFEKLLGFSIVHKGVFEEALTHRSYTSVADSIGMNSNERLEFLGDAILDLIIAEYLFFNKYAGSEGTLTKLRSRLVNKHSLALCGQKLNIEQFLRISHNAAKTIKSGNETILADAMEAVIAAIFIDSGLNKVREFILKKMLPLMITESLLDDNNYKSRLMELVQSQGKKTPEYSVLSEEGQPHDKFFTIGVFVDGTIMGIGQGKNKKDAEQFAAKNALDTHFL